MTSTLRRAPQLQPWTPLDQALHAAQLRFHRAQAPLLQLARLAELERLGELSPRAMQVRAEAQRALASFAGMPLAAPEEPPQ